MSKGIVLFAFGRRGYAYMACNLAISIKFYNKTIPITLYIDEKILSYIEHDLDFFDDVYTLPFDVIYKERVGIDPANVKINVPRFLPYNENLYLDVDGVCVKDLAPLLENLSKEKGYYLTQVIDKGGFDKKILYDIWAKKEKIWDFFELNEKSIYPAVQTSFAYFKKRDDLTNFYEKLSFFYKKGFKQSDITQRWGGTLPDELFYAGTCAHLDYDPTSKQEPIFFGNIGNQNTSFEDIKNNYYVSAIYGNGKGNTLTRRKFFDFYDNELKLIYEHFGKQYLYDTKAVLKDKHANF